MEKVITVDAGRCVGCGMCVRDCGMSCLELGEDKRPRYMEGAEDRCSRCQHCLAVCPAGALSFGGLDPAGSSALGSGDAESLLALIKSRRSIRAYRDADLPAEAVERLREMLAYTPTGGNADSLHISIVGSRSKMREVVEAAYEEVFASEDVSPMDKLAAERRRAGDDLVFRGAPSMAVAAVDRSKVVPGCEAADPIIALSYLELYAQSLGLGTLWNDMATMVISRSPETRELLGIPEGFDIGYVLLLGVPAVKYSRAVQKEPSGVSIIR